MEAVVFIALLVGAAFLAGTVNAVAGGGTLLTFPALIQFGELSPVIANGTSTVALVPGSLAGAWGYRKERDGAGWWLRLLLVPSIVGGLVGSLLVTRLPGSVFSALVPWLLLVASVLFLAQPYLSRWLPTRKEDARPGMGGRGFVVLFQFLVAIYGGYFGAGIGILMITSLGLMGVGDIHRINAVKTLLAAAMNGTSVVVFLIDGKVNYYYAAPMAVGAILGGLSGAAVGRRLPKGVVRWFVIAMGLGLSVYYFVKPAGS